MSRGTLVELERDILKQVEKYQKLPTAETMKMTHSLGVRKGGLVFLTKATFHGPIF